jgi:cell wall-associated NlpC family hydrolase
VTDRATGRHRAPARATTPLSSLGTSLSTKVSGHVTGMSRGGAVLAMSSGLVASMGLPAGAVTHQTPGTGAVPSVANASEATGADRAALDFPSAFVSGAPVSAPASATITLDRSTFTAIPKPKAPTPSPASRSTQRAALTGTSSSGTSTSTPAPGSARGSSVIAIAARYLGVPYLYGGGTPNGFDCSGYTQYVFKQLGVSLPRTADQQLGATTRISRSQAQAGDLVFFVSGGSAYHVGIYAGGGMMYDAGKTGEVITKRAIWSATVVFGRV